MSVKTEDRKWKYCYRKMWEENKVERIKLDKLRWQMNEVNNLIMQENELDKKWQKEMAHTKETVGQVRS